MFTHTYAIGYDNDDIAAAIDPQPALQKIERGEFSFGLDMSGDFDGMNNFDYAFSLLTAEQYPDLLDQFGLDSADYAEGTFGVPDYARSTTVYWNGIIYNNNPPQFKDAFYRDVRFHVILTEMIS